MISQNQIARLLECQEHRHLVDRVLSNGRCRSNAARRALSREGALASAALGLGLQRLVELTYRPSAIADRVCAQLIAMQRPDGLFTNSNIQHESLLSASAVAVRALTMWIDLQRHAGRGVTAGASDAVSRGIAALAGRFLGGIDAHADAVGWAVVLWQLGDVPAFRRAVPTDRLLERLDESAADLLEDELSRYAHAMAA